MTVPRKIDVRIATIPFTKASACGNDFLLVEGAHASGNLGAITRRLCDRHRGVGADGVEWLFPDAEADVPADIKARLINADGSEAEISGNGTRCVAAYVSAEQVSMGNPHFVIFVDNFEDGWQKQAALIATQPQFPQGTNVEYVLIRGASERNGNARVANEIEIRLFERGVGETESSGTGSCAAAVAAITTGRVASPVTVIGPGGTQTVRWENQVYLRGPATLVCRGEFFV